MLNINGHNRTIFRWYYLDSYPKSQQLFVLTIAVFLFFGMHNLLQEAIMKLEGFTFAVMLGYMEVLGVTTCSYIERKYIAKETRRKAPIESYPLLTLCLLSSSGLSNMALNYINFPTKVVFRSCKLIPTMVISTIINRRIFSSGEYVSALAVCIGLVVFAAAEWQNSPSFNPVGLLLVTLSVVADSILPNAQEQLFSKGSSRLEVTFFTNFFTLLAMTLSTLASGDLIGMMQYGQQNHALCLYMLVYTFVAYIAISAFMQVVKRFGGVTAVLLGTARKGMTLILSFLVFPKKFSWFYVLGAILVLGGLLSSSLIKQGKSKKQSLPSYQAVSSRDQTSVDEDEVKH
mmetsp:Transcript_12755/g.19262  ORF Transcript_12755/g.19262 Transcript_12755/m.19262 type:complete len:345 (-) Transcript_12755:114-1148(-)